MVLRSQSTPSLLVRLPAQKRTPATTHIRQNETCLETEMTINGCRNPTLRQRALGLLRERLKPRRILHSNVRQNLAVQFHSGDFQSMDELVVTHPVQLGRRANAYNPQRTILPLHL